MRENKWEVKADRSSGGESSGSGAGGQEESCILPPGTVSGYPHLWRTDAVGLRRRANPIQVCSALPQSPDQAEGREVEKTNSLD